MAQLSEVFGNTAGIPSEPPTRAKSNAIPAKKETFLDRRDLREYFTQRPLSKPASKSKEMEKQSQKCTLGLILGLGLSIPLVFLVSCWYKKKYPGGLQFGYGIRGKYP